MTMFRRTVMAIFAIVLFLAASVGALAVTPEDYSSDHPEILENDHLYAESAFLIDMNTGEILLSKNSRVRVYPASTTKIMTLILALESGIPLEQQVTIPKEADNIPEGSSVIGIKSKDVMTWSDLLYGFMLRSGNDGSNAIAVLTAGSIEAFVARMNEKAEQLHCEGTHFVNAHGYHDEQHYTTAQDLARMAIYGMKNEAFRRIVATGKYDISITRGGKTKTSEIENRNSLVVSDSNYYYPGATGIKTGHHNKSGRCVVASAERTGVSLLAIVMDCSTEAKQFADAKKLFDYGFSQYAQYSMAELLPQLQPEFATVKIENAIESDPGGGTMMLHLGNLTGGDATRMIQRNSSKAMELALSDIREQLNVQWERSLEAPVTVGEVMGTVSFTAQDGTPVSAQLIASRSIEAQPEPTLTPEPTRAPQVERTGGSWNSGDGESNITAPPTNGGAGFKAIAMLILLGVLLIVALTIVLYIRRQRRRRAMARRKARRRRAAAMAAANGKPRNGAKKKSSSRTGSDW